MISVPSGGLVPQSNPNQSVVNMFGVPKYTVNKIDHVACCSDLARMLEAPVEPR
jgi:hypothetical protein